MKRLTKHLALLACFAAVGVLAAFSPLAAAAVLGAAMALPVFLARPQLWRLVVMGLVLAPTMGLVRGSGANGSATAAVAVSDAIESGSLMNKAAATLLFAVGLWCIGTRWGALRRINLIPWFGLFLALVFASLAWSESPPLTLRRGVEAGFIVVFALGAGGVYFARRPQGHAEIVRAICWASCLMTLGILCAFLARGEMHPADSAWRLGHEGTENQVAWVAVVGLLIAWVTRRRPDIWPRRAVLRLQLAVTGLGVLLTKSREVWLGVLAAVVVAELVQSRLRGKRITGLVLVL